MDLTNDPLEYHESGRPGKIEVVPTKSCQTQQDLALAYTPGVAVPCREIQRDPSAAFRYTARGNLVAVISNGTAVLGLGNIGPLAGKPVMEGKGVLFKRFADIDVFDLELATEDPEAFIQAVRLLEPTFGGINLEDIAAPACFRIEEELVRTMGIPVFHDDQHGTAIIASAALRNALELTGKDLASVRLTVSGAGAAAIACCRLLLAQGVRREQIVLVDQAGAIYRGREQRMNRYKEEFATDERCRTLAEAMRGADVFLGLSGPDVVSTEMLETMADRPIVLAMANPDPEISYDAAKRARPDAIVATGRSDFPNQVNNVLGFPFIFRGALDVQARAINTEMKLAAVAALAELAKESVPESVQRAYGSAPFHFGADYIIPKPFDPRVLLREASAVAKAAIDSGVAGKRLDLEEYREQLEGRLGPAREAMRLIHHRARRQPMRIVYPDGESDRILEAAATVADERLAHPILLGDEARIRAAAAYRDLRLDGVTIVDPSSSERLPGYAAELYALRHRKGVTRDDARRMVHDPSVFGSLMVHLGDADGIVSGITQHYSDGIRPILRIVGARDGVRHVVGVFMLTFRSRSIFLADATVNVEPDAEGLAETAILAAEAARRFGCEPRVAMLSFSNFGSVDHRLVRLVRDATRLVRERDGSLVIDGEMQADTAVTPAISATHFPFSAVKGDANVLVFPDLTSANIAYKLLYRLGDGHVVGPILVGTRKPAHVLHQASEVRDVVNLTAIAVADAQELSRQAAARSAARTPDTIESPRETPSTA